MSAVDEYSTADEGISPRYLERASDVYDRLVFNDSDDLYNEPAPEPWVAFMLGGFFSLVGFVYFCIRLHRLKQQLVAQGAKFQGSLLLRAMISAFIDSDNPGYVMTKMAAQSLLFLGGLQYDYEITFLTMLGYFAFESCFDSLRILLAFFEVNSLSELILTGKGLKTKLRKATAQLKPTNVYEDVSRPNSIVLMVFITQVVLIAFVVRYFVVVVVWLVGPFVRSTHAQQRHSHTHTTTTTTTTGG